MLSKLLKIGNPRTSVNHFKQLKFFLKQIIFTYVINFRELNTNISLEWWWFDDAIVFYIRYNFTIVNIDAKKIHSSPNHFFLFLSKFG